jgi:hypothetical protein
MGYGIFDGAFRTAACVCVLSAILAGFLAFIAGRWSVASNNADDYADCLIHPETTPQVKWVKMTRPTRDAIIDIYAANMDECKKFMLANDRVTTGEAAILWLMEKAK